MALSRMGALVESLRELKMEGREVMLVSSGAVGLGRVQLGLSKEQVSEHVIDKQACAAAGQEMLMSMYHMMFNRLGVRAAQVLITQADLLERHRYVYLTDTLDKLTELGTIPIVNENDVVTGGSKGPQVFSDNDNLSAILASGAGSPDFPLCVLISRSLLRVTACSAVCVKTVVKTVIYRTCNTHGMLTVNSNVTLKREL